MSERVEKALEVERKALREIEEKHKKPKTKKVKSEPLKEEIKEEEVILNMETKEETAPEVVEETAPEVVEEAAPEVAEEALTETNQKNRHVPLKYRTKENDISYSGILHYQHLRLIGWVALAIAQLGVIFSLTATILPSSSEGFSTASNILKFFSAFPLPLFMLANFSFILRRNNDFKKMLIFYGGIALILYIAGVLFSTHFLFGFIYNVDPTVNFWEVSEGIGLILANSGSSGYVFNIFIDLFLCALSFFFLHYQPSKYFQGKKIVFFRLLVLLPILYEVGCLVVKFFVARDYFPLSYFFFFLLSAKPPFIFVSFLIIIFAMKIQSISYHKKYKSKKLLNEYLNTNAHGLRVSITTAWSFLICGILDFAALLAFVIIYMFNHGVTDEIIVEGMNIANSVGIGNSVVLILVIPFALLFNYLKKPKYPKLDKFIPIIGIGIVVVIFVEGLFQIVSHKFAEILEVISNFFASM